MVQRVKSPTPPPSMTRPPMPPAGRRPGLRLHDRTMHVQGSSATLKLRLLDFQEEHGLTDAEMLLALNEYAHDIGRRWLES